MTIWHVSTTVLIEVDAPARSAARQAVRDVLSAALPEAGIADGPGGVSRIGQSGLWAIRTGHAPAPKTAAELQERAQRLARSRPLSEMTPAERRAAGERALAQLGRELNAAAPHIARVLAADEAGELDDDPEPPDTLRELREP